MIDSDTAVLTGGQRKLQKLCHKKVHRGGGDGGGTGGGGGKHIKLLKSTAKIQNGHNLFTTFQVQTNRSVYEIQIISLLYLKQ
jgi:hypothetical protein